MEKQTNERLMNLRRQLSFCGDAPIDKILRSQIEQDIRDVLSGKENVAVREDATGGETRVVSNDAWLEDARRRVERIF